MKSNQNKEEIGNFFYIRMAELKDMKEVFELSNEDVVRKFSISKEKIKWDDHVQWFKKNIHDENVIYYIVINEEDRILGQIRYNINESSAIVTINLLDNIRGKGFSKRILFKANQELFASKKSIKTVVAYILKDNIASIKLFESLEFLKKSEKSELIRMEYNK